MAAQQHSRLLHLLFNGHAPTLHSPLLQFLLDDRALAVVLVIILQYVVLRAVRWLWRQTDRSTKLAAGGDNGYEARDWIQHEDLVDPKVRGEHLAFNMHLHRRFAGQRWLPVRGEDRCMLAFTHATCKEILSDAATFSSNPFPDGRLVALNTMSKADHSRVLRYVNSHYAQAEVGRLEDRIRSVIERCTDDLESGVEGSDAVVWAKRIHMASTLARLGVDWLKDGSWDKVDEVVALNDAMVALVAPLGGVGKKYSALPAGWWLHVALGLIRSLPPTLAMVWHLGLRCTWTIIRPDVTVLRPPQRPRMGLWWHPELLPLVPRYFLALHGLLEGSAAAGGPLAGIRKGVESGDLKLAEALTLVVQLMVNMTSANALANMVFRLASEQDAAKMVATDPEHLSAAFVQEVLRLDAPLQRNPRRVAQPLRGKWQAADSPLREGDMVLVMLGAANMDPAVFDEPEKFRLDRGDSDKGTPLSFGSGMHYCLGSNLVKLEMRLALECLLRRFGSVELQGGYKRLVDVDVGNWGFRSLPVRLHRRPA